MWNPLRLTDSSRIPAGVAIIILLAFAGGTLYVGLHHEPWRDEADAWLAARDLPLAEMLPGWTAHAGTPVLWYVALKSVVGLPYRAGTIINLLFAWAAAAILLVAAPLTRLTKILLLGSYFFAYEYAVIARSYALAILLIFLALAMRKNAIAFGVVVALLFNTNVHGGIFAACFFVLATRWSSRAIMACGAAFALWQLWPRGQSNPLAMRGVQANALTALRDAFTPWSTMQWTALIAIAIIALVAISIRPSPRALFVLLATVVALLALYSAVWFGGLRASGMIVVAVIVAIWIANEVPATMASKSAALLLNATLLGSAIFAINVARADIRYAFSGSKEMADFIDHRFDGYEIAAHNFYAAEALLPYLPQHKFWYAGLGQWGTYLKWNAAMRQGAAMPYEAAVIAAQRHFATSKRPWLLLLNAKMPSPESRGFRFVHSTSVVVFRNLDERYWLYASSKDDFAR